MRSWLESGLVALIGAAWAAFLAVLVVGPARAQGLLEGRRGRGEGREREPGWGGGARTLGKDEVVRLPRRAGSVVRVEAGVVLVTREGDPEDHVLEAGGAVALPRRGTAVAWALVPSRIAIDADAGAVAVAPVAPVAEVR
jgi:hypothetical protein